MSATPRGALHSIQRARQLHDFSGLAYGNITPTDLDGLIDFHDKAFAFFEVKLEHQDLGAGQKLAFVRIVDRIQQSGAKAALFWVNHSERDVRAVVDASRCCVVAIYYKKKWTMQRPGLLLRDAVDRFLGVAAQRATPAPVHQEVHNGDITPTAEEVFR